MALIWWILWVEKRCLLEYTIQQTIKQIEKIHSRNTHTLQSPSDRKQCKRWREVNEKRVLNENRHTTVFWPKKKKLSKQSAAEKTSRSTARCQHFLTRHHCC